MTKAVKRGKKPRPVERAHRWLSTEDAAGLILEMTDEIGRLQKEIAYLTELIRQNMPHVLDKSRRG